MYDTRIVDRIITTIGVEEAPSLMPALAADIRFAHYTSADVLMNILEQRVLWMRDTRLMNDTQEVIHSQDKILETLNGEKCKNYIAQILEVVGRPFDEADVSKLLVSVEKLMAKSSSERIPYVLCFSKHCEDEANNGRLSMWRAYNKGQVGVALIFKPFREKWGRIAPVQYLPNIDIQNYVEFVIAKIVGEHLDEIDSWVPTTSSGGRAVAGLLAHFIRTLSVYIKHEGFSEEQEWRIALMGRNIKNSDDQVYNNIRVINGIPQRVFYFPLEDGTKVDVKDNSTKKLKCKTKLENKIETIIIGPCADPEVIKQSILLKMEEEDIKFKSDNIKISRIPLRLY